MMNRQQLIVELNRDEGFRARAYRDHLGFVTIGIGFMIDPGHKGAIRMPRPVADLWMSYLIKNIERRLNNKIPWWRKLSDARQRALVNMAYQMGISDLLAFPKMLAAMEREDFETAEDEALDSIWAREQTPERAQRIARMIGIG